MISKPGGSFNRQMTAWPRVALRDRVARLASPVLSPAHGDRCEPLHRPCNRQMLVRAPRQPGELDADPMGRNGDAFDRHACMSSRVIRRDTMQRCHAPVVFGVKRQGDVAPGYRGAIRGEVLHAAVQGPDRCRLLPAASRASAAPQRLRLGLNYWWTGAAWRRPVLPLAASICW